ncbi:hypothetical protein QZH41_000632 [Actinostola sp. cb2023]|nr:hypothetical protein QZH41_000632 [Actinostola sp. cb2023]
MVLWFIIIAVLLLGKNASILVVGQNPMSRVYRHFDGIPISLQGYKLNGFQYKVLHSSEGEDFCELNSKGISSVAEGIASSLHKMSKCIYVQTQTPSIEHEYPTTCADHYKTGIRESGLYYIRDANDRYYHVYCDFHSEPNKSWTLIMSGSFKNRGLRQFKIQAFIQNDPLKEDDPNWDSYRLSLPRMQHISRSSSHWRITCNFPQDGLSYVDYVRALLLGQTPSVLAVAQNPMSEVYRQIDGILISLQGYKLNGFQYKVLHSVSLIGCGQACLAEFPKCVSYNYYTQYEGEEFCELNSKGISSVAKGIASSLQKVSNCIYVQTQTPSMEHKYPTTCADQYKTGIRGSGLYYIRDANHQYYHVYCDFHSEPNKVWTLIMSASFKNRAVRQFQIQPFIQNSPLKEDDPNWDSYRLSLPRMQHISRSSSHWRITCNFPQDELNYVDYVRGKISDVDMLSCEGREVCKRVEYINVLNHACTGCTVAWWQINGAYIFHHDITFRRCEFGATPGGINSQDVFGFYASVNPKFRCCLSDKSNTNYWFGNDV